MSKRSTWVGLVAMALWLVATAAMAQPERDAQKWPGPTGKGVSIQAGGKVVINGKEDAELSQQSRKVGNELTVPAKEFFQKVGAEEVEEKGWVPPGSRDPDRDRDIKWRVARREGHEIRWRPGERLFYYDRQPRYFSVAPYDWDDRWYIPLAQIIGLLGGGYNYYYPPYRYGYGGVTLCEAGYCPAYGEIRLTYPYEQQALYGGRVPVQGYAPPGTLVHVQIDEDVPWPYGRREILDRTVRASRSGFFATEVWVPRYGSYLVRVESVDPYGGIIAQKTRRFYVR